MRKWRHLKDLGMLKECIFAIIFQRKCSSKYSIDRNDLKDLFDVLQYDDLDSTNSSSSDDDMDILVILLLFPPTPVRHPRVHLEELSDLEYEQLFRYVF